MHPAISAASKIRKISQTIPKNLIDFPQMMHPNAEVANVTNRHERTSIDPMRAGSRCLFIDAK
jgi:hypothetical protein